MHVFGNSNKSIVIREKYFDGKNIVTQFRNPWKESVEVDGTDAMSFHPDFPQNGKPRAFLDELSRNAKFHYYDTKVHHGVTTYRFLLDEDLTVRSPENSIYYMDKYNGYANMTPIIKAPMFAHKPYYYQCNDTPAEMLPEIKMLNWTSNNAGEPDDQKLFNESFFDIEPFSGGPLKAAQKLMISALIERDELFEVDSKFVPIYYIFRTGNLSESKIDEIFGPLKKGLGLKSTLNIILLTLTTLFLCLAAYAYIGRKLERNNYVSSSEIDKSSPLV